VGSVARQRLVKTNQEDLLLVIANRKVSELTVMLQLLVIAYYRDPINRITNPNPVCNH
jgi:hypothetical protein